MARRDIDTSRITPRADYGGNPPSNHSASEHSPFVLRSGDTTSRHAHRPPPPQPAVPSGSPSPSCGSMPLSACVLPPCDSTSLCRTALYSTFLSMNWRIKSSRWGLVPLSFMVLFPALHFFGKTTLAQVALLLFLIYFWVFRTIQRKEHAERIARSRAEYSDQDSLDVRLQPLDRYQL